MRIKILILCIAMVSSINLFSQVQDNAVINSILSAYSEKSYSTDQITDKQLSLILQCGIKAPSSRNRQPWRFTVIKDLPAMKEAVGDVKEGNVLVIISGLESDSGSTPDFDCGLATESMFVAAHGLGLGARIYGGPIGNVISKRDFFEIPKGYKPVVILRLGNVDKSIDAITAATPRMSYEEIVNYKKSN
jgi:nitroreductase